MEDLKDQFNDAVKAVTDSLKGLDVDSLKDIKIPASKEEVLEITEKYDKKFDGVPFLDELVEQTQIPKSILVGVIGVASLLFTIVSFNVKFLGVFTTNLIGYAYPAYASIKAINSEQKDDDTKWLTYWVVYSYFFLFEMLVLGPVAQVSAFGRTYFLAKVAALTWCQFGGGATILYNLVVYPLTHTFFKTKEKIEDYLGQFEEYNNSAYMKRAATKEDEDEN